MKKMTKKQMQEEARIKMIKRQDRQGFINSIRSYWKDCEATKRYYEINNMDDKFESKYSKTLKEEETMRLFNNYENLRDYAKYFTNLDTEKEDPRFWAVTRTIVKNGDIDDYYFIKDFNPTYDLVIDDIIWNEEEIKLIIELARNFGYERILFLDNSTAALRTIAGFVKNGCKVSDKIVEKFRRFRVNDEWTLDSEGIAIEL